MYCTVFCQGCMRRDLIAISEVFSLCHIVYCASSVYILVLRLMCEYYRTRDHTAECDQRMSHVVVASCFLRIAD